MCEILCQMLWRWKVSPPIAHHQWGWLQSFLDTSSKLLGKGNLLLRKPYPYPLRKSNPFLNSFFPPPESVIPSQMCSNIKGVECLGPHNYLFRTYCLDHLSCISRNVCWRPACLLFFSWSIKFISEGQTWWERRREKGTTTVNHTQKINSLSHYYGLGMGDWISNSNSLCFLVSLSLLYNFELPSTKRVITCLLFDCGSLCVTCFYPQNIAQATGSQFQTSVIRQLMKFG